MNRTKSTYLALVAVLLAPVAANADLINFSVQGEFYAAGTDNVFDLVDGDIITMTGTYDDASLTGTGVEYLGFSVFDVLNSFEVTIGTFLIDNTMDVYFDSGYTFLEFTNGIFSGMQYELSEGVNAAQLYFQTSGNFFRVYTSTSTSYSAGSWNLQSFTATAVPEPVTAVPEPGTLALFGLGLAAIGITRRRRKV